MMANTDQVIYSSTPSGSSTASIARPLNGNVLYGGGGIYDCVAQGVMALTFDDGPYIYTSDILDVLKSYNAKATFFITGNNLGKGAIDTNWAPIIKRMVADGHQIASHTWSHQNLNAITTAQRKEQMIKNEMAFRNILGYFPTYMRPPYSECNTACGGEMKTLGYHVTYFDVDTDDYANTTPDLIQNAKDNFDNQIRSADPSQSDFLVIGHDIHEQTARNLTAYMLQRMKTLGYKAVTVGECLNDPAANWYRSAGGVVLNPTTSTTVTPSNTAGTTSTTNAAGTTKATGTTAPSPASTLKVSTDGKCGTGKTCLGSTYGNCCSAYGWCGSTSDHCGTGCQSSFGSCGSNPASVSSSSPTSTSVSSSLPPSTNGACGNGKTCTGSTFGNCCSKYGWCGSTAAYCGTGCQKAFGSCT
jgi:peptidoglycan/xylan/chitin deacetylase (PgdA/CDA1 family)